MSDWSEFLQWGSIISDFFMTMFFYIIPVILVFMILVVILKKFGIADEVEYHAPLWAYRFMQFFSVTIYIFLIAVFYAIYQLMNGNMTLEDYIDYTLFTVLKNIIYYFMLHAFFTVLLGTDGANMGVPTEILRKKQAGGA